VANVWAKSDAMIAAELDAYTYRLNALGTVWHIHLYTNAYDPVANDSVANYTEAAFGSYSINAINQAHWGAASVTAHIATSTNSDTQAYSPSSGTPVTIVGYYITLGDDTTWVYAERFAASRTLNVGDTLNVTPALRNEVA